MRYTNPPITPRAPREAQPRTFSPDGVISHLHALPSGTLVALHRKSEGAFVIVGEPGETFRSIPATDVQVMRDGGTLYARTAEGTLHVPQTMRKDDRKGAPTWQGKPLTKVDASDYAIDPSGPTVTPAAAAPAP